MAQGAMGVRFRFGDYVIDPMARTLTCRGVAQDVEPRVFDVIVLLMTHRDRVVTKPELLASVWGTRVVVTEGVIARTVMKARRLLGDDAGQPTAIRTVPRVGYRFVAPAAEVADPRASSPVRATAVPGRVAILPFRDETESADLGWIDFGLMSMTVDALALQDGDSSVVPAADLLSVVGAANPVDDLAALVRRLAAALGTVDVVQATVGRDERGTLRLRYLGAGPNLASFAGELRGSDPVELCRQLAAAVRAARAVAPEAGGAAPVPVDDVAGKDARFARMARARALQAIHAEQWGMADKLLRVALDLVPDDPAMQLERARCRVAQRDPEAGAMLEHALERARSTANGTLELRALHLLANHRRTSGDFAEAERLLSQALSMAEQLGDREAELQLLMSIAKSFVDEGRLQVGAWLLERADRLARSLGNQVAMARLLDTRARIAVLNAEPAAALATFAEAAALSEQHGLHASGSFSRSQIGNCLLDQGRMAQAAEAFERAFALACRSGDAHAVGVSGCRAVRHGALRTGDFDGADQAVERMRGAGATPGCVDLAHACISARRGRLDDAAAHLERAEHGLSSSPGLRAQATRSRIRVLLGLGRTDAARGLCETIGARAPGRLRSAVVGAGLHLQALVAHADGAAEDALRFLLESASAAPATADGAAALLDAAWLQLDAGDVDAARRTLRRLGGFLPASLADEHGPSMLVQARFAQATGDGGAAMALEKRFRERFGVAPSSAAAHRRSADGSGAGAAGTRLSPPPARLPSLAEWMPGPAAAGPPASPR